MYSHFQLYGKLSEKQFMTYWGHQEPESFSQWDLDHLVLSNLNPTSSQRFRHNGCSTNMSL